MNRSRIHVLLILPVMMLAACTTTPESEECEPPKREVQPGELDVIISENPRPKACTREYDPVCATLMDGSTETFSTGCTSCSDLSVKSYRKGACDQS